MGGRVKLANEFTYKRYVYCCLRRDEKGGGMVREEADVGYIG